MPVWDALQINPIQVIILSQAIKCFRTITRCGIFRQAVVASVPVLLPIGIAVPPNSISINPGDSIDEPTELALDGTIVPSFTFTKERKGEVELEFGMATLEMESIIHGRVAKAITGAAVPGFIYMEFIASSTTPTAARPAGMLGNALAALAADSTAIFYYLDPATKLAHPMTVVASAPSAIDEIQVGEGLAVTISEALAATGYQVNGWVPDSFAAGVVLSATPLGLLSIFAQGISFDNASRLFTLRNCSRLPGSPVASDSKRSMKFRILPDLLDGTGLGYSIIDTPALTVV